MTDAFSQTDVRDGRGAWSLFSGSGGFDLGLEQAGWEIVLQCEIDPFRQRVLEHYWPGVERIDDVRDCRPVSGQSGAEHSRQSRSKQPLRRDGGSLHCDLICGGFPCQDLSVAGKRAGLSGSRSGLFWEFARIVGEVRPTWVLIENVPGLLSSNGGDDFALILNSLDELGYGWAYRILDSRYFGVPQRRRRVYIVGHSSGRIDYPAAVLFESESGGGDTPSSGAAREDVAYTLAGSTYDTGWKGADHETYVPEVAYSLKTTEGKQSGSPERNDRTLIAGTVTGAEGHNGNSRPIPDNYVTAIQERAISEGDSGPDGKGWKQDGSSYTLEARNKVQMVHAQTVRRLTPVECERLQGFPDGWTDIPGAKDGPRYAAMGDAVSVPVIRWIGERMIRL